MIRDRVRRRGSTRLQGLREGEAVGLRKTSVDWSEGLLYVEGQRQGGRSANLKTKAGAAMTADAAIGLRLQTRG
ncbi:hypothetical protein [Streptomyces sp. NPDC004270]